MKADFDIAEGAKRRLSESFKRARTREKDEQRAKRRELGRRVWLTRPFWSVCWFAAWWPASVEMVRGFHATLEPYVWSWAPLQLNGELIGDRIQGLCALLLACLLWKLALSKPPD